MSQPNRTHTNNPTIYSLQTQYTQLQSRNLPVQIKIQLLQCIKEQLKVLLFIKTQTGGQKLMRSVSLKTNYQDSFITTMLSIDELETHSCEVASSRLAPRELEQQRQLETRILQKQEIKVWLNEEIECYQDDYLQMQRVMLQKQYYCQDLDKRISRITFASSKSIKSLILQGCAAKAKTKISLRKRIKEIFS